MTRFSNILRGSLAACAASLLCSSLFAGPIGTSGTLYLTAADQKTGVIVSGTTFTTFSLSGSQESPIAVINGTVSTDGYAPGATGSIYDLSGNLITAAANTLPGIGGFFIDGASDGTNIYTVDFTSGQVVRLNSTWGSPTNLFVAAGTNPASIAYDTLSNTLFIADYQDSTVSQYSLGGSFISSFSTGHIANTALAYDATDNSLWLANRTVGSALTLEQYSTTGSALQTLSSIPLASLNVLGGEFAPPTATPEPASLTLIGLGLLALGATKRRLI